MMRLFPSSRCQILHAASLGAVLASAPATLAAEDDFPQCVEAFNEAQSLRKEGALVAARDKLIICGSAKCPAVVQSTCTKWLDEVEKNVPTVVIQARGPDGEDAIAVVVKVDEELLTSQLDGRALAVDPGIHVLRFEFENGRVVEKRVVIQEGVKNRLISIAASPPKAPRDPKAVMPPPSPQPSRASPKRDAMVTPEQNGPHTLAYVLGGVGAIGVGAFVALASSYDRQYEELDACRPQCNSDDVDRASATRQWALVSGAFGVAALGTATVLWLKDGSPNERGAARMTSRVGVALSPRSAAAAWTASF